MTISELPGDHYTHDDEDERRVTAVKTVEAKSPSSSTSKRGTVATGSNTDTATTSSKTPASTSNKRKVQQEIEDLLPLDQHYHYWNGGNERGGEVLGGYSPVQDSRSRGRLHCWLKDLVDKLHHLKLIHRQQQQHQSNNEDPGSDEDAIKDLLLKERIVRAVIFTIAEESIEEDLLNRGLGVEVGEELSSSGSISPSLSLSAGVLYQIFDLCGFVATITTSSTILKEIVTSSFSAASEKQNTDAALSERILVKNSTSSPLQSEFIKVPGTTRTKLVEMCWWTIQQQLLPLCDSSTVSSDDTDCGWKATDDINTNGVVDWNELISKTIFVLPQTVANAYYHVASGTTALPTTSSSSIPLDSTPSHFFPRLVQSTALQYCRLYLDSIVSQPAISKVRWFHQYTLTLFQTLLNSGPHRADAVVQGLMDATESVEGPNETDVVSSTATDSSTLSPLLHIVLVDSKFTWTAREVSTLISTLLKYLEANQIKTVGTRKTSCDTSVGATATFQARTILQTCQHLFHSINEPQLEQQDIIVQNLAFTARNLTTSPNKKRSTNISNKRAHRWAKWIVQILTPPTVVEDCDVGDDWVMGRSNKVATRANYEVLMHHLTVISDRWSQWTFVQEVDVQHQRYVTLILWYGIRSTASVPATNETTSEATSSSLLATSDTLTMNLVNGISCRLETSLDMPRQDGMRIAQEMAKRLGQEVHFDEYRPDDDDIDLEKTGSTIGSSTDEGDRQQQNTFETSSGVEVDGNDDEASVEWADELVPYDLDDDEEDLMETPKPLTLIAALDLLRTAESHERAYSRHEVAFSTLPDLIRKRPDNLPDIAVSLASQVLRMENKFNLPMFAEMRDQILQALVVQEPVSVGQAMIDSLFDEGGLGDRLVILSTLQMAAFELSGNTKYKMQDAGGGSEITSGRSTNTLNRSIMASKPWEGLSLSKTIRKRSKRAPAKTVKNYFAPVAPIWFYGLMSGFLKNTGHDNESLWEGCK